MLAGRKSADEDSESTQTGPRFHPILELHRSPASPKFGQAALRVFSFVYCRLLIALCADTFVALYFGWQSTIALTQPGTPDSMVPFAGLAFWPAPFFSRWLVGHGHSLTAKRGPSRLWGHDAGV